MLELLHGVLRVATIVFTVASMLSVGFSYTAGEILRPLRGVRHVLLALAANFLLVPLLALGLVRVLPLEPPVGLGLFVLACSAGAPFLIKLLDVAEGDVGRGATLLVLLTPGTVLFVPLAVSWVLDHPALTELAYGRVDAWAIARPLLLSILLPLGVGLLVRARAPGRAGRLRPAMSTIASVALVVLVTSAVLTNLRGLLDLVGYPLLAVLLLVAGAFGVGWVVGGPGGERRVVFGLGTAQRGVAAATVVATETVDHPDCTTMVVGGAVVGLLALLPVAAALGRLPSREAAAVTAPRRR